LVHGDAHEHNTLSEPPTEPGTAPTNYKLVDPDGLFFEAAYDLGILLRNWIEAYRIADPARVLIQRATWLAKQTHVSRQAIISWGFVEIVSTGIHLLELGYAGEGQKYLDLGQALLPVT
jgi:streptomycin 6-kinase